MTRLHIAAALTGVLLAACETPPQRPDETRAAMQEFDSCLVAQAAELDDRTSNARSVGLSVMRACGREGDRVVIFASYGEGPAFASGVADAFWRQAQEQATQTVLRQRAARNKQ